MGGNEGCCVREGWMKGGRGGGWWLKVLDVGGVRLGGWFFENLSRHVGNGRDTKLWVDRWVGGKPLRFVFPRLFQLCENKNVSIEESGRWENGSWSWELKWRRELFEWEKWLVNDLIVIISDGFSCSGNSDEWRWKATKNGKFTTKSAYQIIAASRGETQSNQLSHDVLAKVWEAPAPHKVKVTAWRCLRNRVATCYNLFKRHVDLSVEEAWCNSCILREATTDHLFLTCAKIDLIWGAI
ncbi:uncharacterized protein LOC131019067 [Salvia miltiorrhiza]|uniref:uncharacterized protein LOC131019067 n=1 Tax=Salvia miltiorrhiza TaxID=226208 RepID=UPI0025AD26BF|nr:uncharacterized protein LOC131019067 [Salvia miltiorrhiza]